MKSTAGILLVLCVMMVYVEATDPCANYKCPCGQRCRLQRVFCIKAPCPPTPTCIVEECHNTTANVCEINYPVLDANNNELFCGRGPNSVTCPDHTTCRVDRGDRYAVCCYTGPQIKPAAP